MYSIYNLVLLGTVLLFLYIIIDFIRNRARILFRRIVFYSFIFYMLVVAQLTTGGIIIPPQKDFAPTIQLAPFYSIGDLFRHSINGLDWFFWNSFKLTFFNFIMLMPLGIYLSVLFKVRRKSKAFLIVFLLSITIETMQLSFSYFGLIKNRAFDIDDIIMNSLGGFIAFELSELIKKVYTSMQKEVKFNHKTIKRNLK